jgi:BirA family transcriptional regulator, biotin operon repressor / biotin---[acetyl-CoA-carboxylase] ligase
VIEPASPPAADTHTTLGYPRIHLRRTDSTNERARELAIAGAPHGTLVTAAEQTAGRGRQGRRWSAPAGSAVLMSLLLRQPPELLPLMAAVAVCDAAAERARIKWPNDVVLDVKDSGRDDVAGSALGAGAQSRTPLRPATQRRAPLAKLAGILVEARLQERWAVLGIGLNVAVRLEDLPAELRPGGTQPAGEGSGLPAATLGLTPSDVEPMLARLIGALERRLAEDPSTVLAAWRAKDALRGREIMWSGGSGRAGGIDGTGRLIVTLAGGGSTTLGSGEVHLLSIGEQR